MSTNEVETFLSQVKAELDEHYLNLWKAHVTDEPPRLFHYTSTEGLLGIVKHRKFFISDMFASTDQSEIRHGIRVVRELLEKTPDDPISKTFLEGFERTGLWGGLGSRVFVHAICFCRGDDVLTQWRGYAPNAGIALGVDFSAIKTRAEQAEFALGRMLYEPDKQRDMVLRTLDRGRGYLPRLRAIFRTVPESFAKSALDGLMTEVGICLLKSLLLFKHSAFHSEDEWRVLTLESSDTLRQKLQFRVRGGA